MGDLRRHLGAVAALTLPAVLGAGCSASESARSVSTAPAASRPVSVPAVTTDAGLPPAGPVTPPRAPRRVLWSRENIAGTVAVVHGTLVAATNVGSRSGVADFDARTGRLRWRQIDPAAFPMQTVTTAGTVTAILGSPDTNSVAQVTQPRVIHTFDLTTGRLLWTRRVPQNKTTFGPNSQLAVTSRTVLIAEGVSTVTDVDARTGRTRWISRGSGTCSLTANGGTDRDYPSPLVADASTTVIARSCGSTAVDALDSGTGAPRWSWPTPGSGLRAPRGAAVAGLADGVVFLSAAATPLTRATRVASVLHRHGIAATPLLALDARTGRLLWSEPGALVGTVVADGPHAACLMSSGGYECRDVRTGRLLFTPTEFDPGTAVYGSTFNTTIAYPHLYQLVPAAGGAVRLTTRNATTGRLLASYVLPRWKWTVRSNGYHPAVIAAGAGLVLLQRTDIDPRFPLIAYR